MNNVICSNNISFGVSMKICIVSAKPRVGSKKKNLDKIEKYISQEKADMYVFGELFLTGYFCRDDIRDVAEDSNGESIKRLKKMAKEHDCYIICGAPLKEREGIISNSAILIHPNGKLDAYRKTFLANFGPFEERFYFLAENNLPVFETRYGKIGICICYDIFFPELVKGLALQGADLIVCISASPSVTRKFFEKVLPARAIENTVFVAYANLVGSQENLVFWGGGQIYNPMGELMARGDYLKEGYVVANIDFSLLENARASRPTIRDTKAEIFHALYNIAKIKGGQRGYAYIGMKIGEYAFKKMKVEKVIVYGKKELIDGICFATGCKKDAVSFKEGKAGAKFIGKNGELKIFVKDKINEAIENGMDSILPFLDGEKIFDVEE